ncbi:site-specific integrase [Cryobacterium sp. TMT1-2-2]|nr:site-specific integrase [Cryobacterium sp. TMT1-2-2]
MPSSTATPLISSLVYSVPARLRGHTSKLGSGTCDERESLCGSARLVLALRWSALDLVAGTVAINANVIRARGQGVLLQDHTKTKAGVRTIAIPKNLVDLLRQRQSNFKIQNDDDLAFPTLRGNIRDPRNTSRDWRMARERTGYPTVTTHSFRKTVATALDQSGLSAREIAEYLGHANPSLTQDVSMAKNTGGIRAAETMNSLLPTQ